VRRAENFNSCRICFFLVRPADRTRLPHFKFYHPPPSEAGLALPSRAGGQGKHPDPLSDDELPTAGYLQRRCRRQTKMTDMLARLPAVWDPSVRDAA
jgi:hypothetical protein